MTDEKLPLCSDLAWEYGVSLKATATRGDIWFLIEYPGKWDSKAYEMSEIPDTVKAYIKTVSNPDKLVRNLLIRRPENQRRGGVKFFIGSTHSSNPLLYEYDLDNYSDILDLDLISIVTGKSIDQSHERTKPLYLICTNGKRDKCCAIFGPQVYQAMSDEAGDAVWQSSHIGSHNQAPITLFFPHGVNYGRTTPSEASKLIKAYEQDRVVLHHYRGRVCFDTHIQAAEHFWRDQTGVMSLPGMQIESVDEMGENQWNVTIRGENGLNKKNIRLHRRESDYKIPITCSGTKVRSIASFHRIE